MDCQVNINSKSLEGWEIAAKYVFKKSNKTKNVYFFRLQSRYFEFDDSDSYSEKSYFSDEIDLFGDDDNYFDVDDDDNIYDYYDENYFTALNNQKCWTEKTSNSVSASLSDLSIESERDSTQT